jgi:tetratricopeptide (TPR) repeat protein
MSRAVDPAAVAALQSLWQQEADVDETRWAYRDAAAVLDVFVPQDIRPRVGDPLPGGYPDPGADAAPVAGLPGDEEAEAEQWRLLPEVRYEALARLGTRDGFAAALAANPERAETPVQRMFEAVVADSVPPLGTLSRDELGALLAVCRWLDGVLPAHELPHADELSAAFARADLLAPCRHLLVDGFVDRKRQLEKLRHFLWQEGASPPLLLHGIGGMGKSTLLAKLTVDEFVEHGERMLLVPIDVDRPSVRPHHPHTFLLEAVSQIVRQAPERRDDGESIANHLRELGSRYSVSVQGHEYEGSRYSEKGVEYIQSELVEAFSHFLRSVLPDTNARALITVDTFEEAQVLGTEISDHLVMLFDRLARTCAEARVIVSGRVPADEPFPLMSRPEEAPKSILADAPRILLKSLDKRSALSLLMGQLEDQSPRPERAALEQVLTVVGRNPMCIKLAARIIRLEGTDALLSPERRNELIAHLRNAKIHAFLFGRILDHFQTGRIKPLAYPGLIVRRVTPEIIRHVLAGPCGIELDDPAEAEGLFQELAHERTMVEPDRAGGLRYRPELRRELLGDVLRKVSKQTANAIDRAAVEFYRKDDSREGRAEEIYHRLRLGWNLDEVEARWMPGLKDLLRSSLDELPESGRLWLARKLNITVGAALRDEAGQEDWEGIARLRAERFLRNGDGARALDALGERTERLPNSVLFQLEAEALKLNGELAAARAVAERGLESATGDRRAELLLQLASLHEVEHENEAALPLVREAAEVAEGRDDPMLPFRALVTQVRLLRKLGRFEERDAQRSEALRQLTNDTLKQLRRYPRLFEETAAELGEQNRAVLRAAVQQLGVHVRSVEQGEALADVFHDIWEDGLENKVKVPTNLDPTLLRRMGRSKRAAEELVRQSEGAGLGRFTADLIKVASSGSPGASRLTDFFKASVEQGLGGSFDLKKL